jgi:N utilization substance protein B
MPARRRARRRALDVLYESEMRSLPLGATLAARASAAENPFHPYVATLVEGVVEHQERIDELLATYSVGWPLHRMPAVDRNILRIGTFELLWSDVPEDVVLSEAADIAGELSTDDSPDFVSGLLGRIKDLKPELSR